MTAYSVSIPAATASSGTTFTTTASFQVSLTAVLYPIQLIDIEVVPFSQWWGTGGGSDLLDPYSLVQYVGMTASGGAGALTPDAARANAAPASATSRYGTATAGDTGSTVSASSTPLTFTGGTSTVLRSESAPANYKFPVDYIYNPGSTFVVEGTAVAGSGSATAYPSIGFYGYETLVIWFEELHLARSR